MCRTVLLQTIGIFLAMALSGLLKFNLEKTWKISPTTDITQILILKHPHIKMKSFGMLTINLILTRIELLCFHFCGSKLMEKIQCFFAFCLFSRFVGMLCAVFFFYVVGLMQNIAVR